MVESKVVKINSSFYVNVPAHEARRLGLHEGQPVELDVKPLRPTLRAIMDELRKTPKRKLTGAPLTNAELDPRGHED